MIDDCTSRPAGGSVARHAELVPEMTEEHRNGAIVSGSGAFASENLEKPSWGEHSLASDSDPRPPIGGPTYGASWDDSSITSDTKVYIGYTFVNPTGEVYSGIASGYGDPDDILKQRWRNHHQDEFGKFWDEGRYAYGVRVEVVTASTDAVEGWEKRSVDRWGGPLQYGGTSANWKNPVGEKRFDRLNDAQHDEFPGFFPLLKR